MASYLMTGLAESHTVGAVGLFPKADSVIEHRLADAHIPMWHLDKRPGFDPRMYSSLHRVFRNFRPHVVHTHMAVQRYVFPVLLRYRSTAAIHTIHNLAEHETDAVGRVVHWFAFRKNVLPVGISQEVSASVKRVYGVPCTAIIPNCVPVEQYRLGSDTRRRWREQQHICDQAIVFICVSRLEPQKNPLLVLRAFSELADQRTHLVLLGDGSLREKINEFVREKQIGARVHLLGKIGNVSDALAASDVFVLGSDWEGNPLAVMEAMAAGLPVVATGVGGVPELVRHGTDGFLVPVGAMPAFAHAMKRLIENPEERKRMAVAAQTRAFSEFRVERMVSRYADLYQEMLKRRPELVREHVTGLTAV
jgi:glycosyltransferase involved in cell wall biosynthesis